MESQRAAISIAFLFAFLPTLLGPIFAPQLHLNYFAPFLVLLLYKRSLVNSLWWAIACGIIVDLLSAQPHFGIYALTYSVTIALLSRLKGNFFEDKPTTLPIMTYLFAVTATVLMTSLSFLFSDAPRLSWQWAATDLILMPIADAIYAATWFALPAFLLRRRPRRATNMLLKKN